MTPDEVFSLRALWDATRRAARHKRSTTSVARFLLTLESQLVSLRDELLADRWRPSNPVLLDVRDPKPRTISVLPFRDRVVHQALWAVLSPRVERRLIADTYASRQGHGTHAALRRARAWARSHRWSVHLDVARYFPSIDHDLVRAHLRRDLAEPWLRALCDRMYLRYMDDMLLFHDDRAELMRLARAVEAECNALRLRLHPWDVMPTREGVGFVGYRVLPDHVRVRRTTVARAERRLLRTMALTRRGELPPEDLWDSLRSTFGHWSHADSWRLKERTLRRLGLLYDPSEEIPRT